MDFILLLNIFVLKKIYTNLVVLGRVVRLADQFAADAGQENR